MAEKGNMITQHSILHLSASWWGKQSPPLLTFNIVMSCPTTGPKKWNQMTWDWHLWNWESQWIFPSWVVSVESSCHSNKDSNIKWVWSSLKASECGPDAPFSWCFQPGLWGNGYRLSLFTSFKRCLTICPELTLTNEWETEQGTPHFKPRPKRACGLILDIIPDDLPTFSVAVTTLIMWGEDRWARVVSTPRMHHCSNNDASQMKKILCLPLPFLFLRPTLPLFYRCKDLESLWEYILIYFAGNIYMHSVLNISIASLHPSSVFSLVIEWCRTIFLAIIGCPIIL